jgi:recombinational DNA repair protein (RecF pathway)
MTCARCGGPTQKDTVLTSVTLGAEVCWPCFRPAEVTPITGSTTTTSATTGKGS